jgi:hypothetical protein
MRRHRHGLPAVGRVVLCDGREQAGAARFRTQESCFHSVATRIAGSYHRGRRQLRIRELRIFGGSSRGGRPCVGAVVCGGRRFAGKLVHVRVGRIRHCRVRDARTRQRRFSRGIPPRREPGGGRVPRPASAGGRIPHGRPDHRGGGAYQSRWCMQKLSSLH